MFPNLVFFPATAPACPAGSPAYRTGRLPKHSFSDAKLRFWCLVSEKNTCVGIPKGINRGVLLFFFLFVLSVSAQHSSVISEDYNDDGIEDTLKCSYEIGSNFGGRDCQLIDGKTQTKFGLSNYGCFCKIKQHIAISPELTRPENSAFFDILKREILPIKKQTPDASLQWLINSSFASHVVKDNPNLDLIFNPDIKWSIDAPEAPSTYYIQMSTDSLIKLVPNKNKVRRQDKQSHYQGFLIYYGDTHFSTRNRIERNFIEVDENETYKMLRTGHGILAKKGILNKWLFVTDIDINGSPSKLRWQSIEQIVMVDNLIVVKQSLAPDVLYNIYVIDIETGVGGRLKIDFDFFDDTEISDLSHEERFSVVDDTVHIGSSDKQLKFPLKEIEQNMKEFVGSR